MTSLPALAVPLSQAQVDAANRLHVALKQWMVADRALTALGKAFPHWNLEASLLKVAAINQLYGTNLMAVIRMSEHITAVLAATDTLTAGPELVERIAALPKAAKQKTGRHHYSFAAKLAHFFVDSERFPIYDSYASAMVAYHLGANGTFRDEAHPYVAFIENLSRLRIRSGLDWHGRELDRYLWLAGQYRAWKRAQATATSGSINVELAALFTSPQPAAASDLDILLP